jgi:hypothetical protein
MRMKLCFLMLTAPYSPWIELTAGAKNTWLKEIDTQNDFFFQYIGRPIPLNSNYFVNTVLNSKKFNCLWKKNQSSQENVELINPNTIQIDIVDRWDTMFTKFLCAVRYINSLLDYDYLIKVNTTTWVNVNELRSYLEVNQYSCAGVIDKNKTFPAGWASIFSRDLMENILLSTSKDPLYLSGYDDELIGKVLTKLDVYPERIKYVEYPSGDYREMAETPFIRIKSKSGRILNDLRKFDEVNVLLRQS